MKLSPLSEFDCYLFHQGTHYSAYTLFGAHLTCEEKPGVRFAVWAPRAETVSIVGDFNNWQGDKHQMHCLEQAGIWVLFVPGLGEGAVYKYQIKTKDGRVLLKADPYAFEAEKRPHTASIVCSLDHYSWHDQQWFKKLRRSEPGPMLIYEVHLGSWRQGIDDAVYRQLASELVAYVASMGYTHIELMPLTEHPLDASWGYQVTGYYAVTSRYGKPGDFMYFVDQCHQQGIGVIMDWVPGHFCKDNHGLREFDGSCLYESADPLKKENLQWGTAYFDFSKKEVWSFLISNALFWRNIYHVDGFRVDAVASILYLDYGKEAGQWRANEYGGNGNLDAARFLQKLNEVLTSNEQTLMFAEESTTWPYITRSSQEGGMGFNYKWNMGWMNDILRYMGHDPIYRKELHNLLTFSFMYAFSEKFVLPLSHDEVVHGKKSLLDKMPGDYWQKFANLRLLYGYMMAHPGKKLLFMGGEFGQFAEWSEQKVLDWHLLAYDMHKMLHHYVHDLNYLYRREQALWENDDDWSGFTWIDPNDYRQSVITFMRRAKHETIIIVCNFTPVVRYDYRIGVPECGNFEELFNSDRVEYGGSGVYNEMLIAENMGWHNQPYSLRMTIPPLAVLYLVTKTAVLTARNDVQEGDRYEPKRMYSDDISRGAGQQTRRVDQESS